MEVWLKLEKDRREEEKKLSQFKSLIRSLKCLVHTRPDITCSVNYLSTFMNKPHSEHMNAAKRILRYIKGTLSFGLKYERGKKNYTIQGYNESDFARDNDDQKSTTGQIFFLGNSAITWNRVKKNVVASLITHEFMTLKFAYYMNT